ncbi:unnamed protein product [Soboliphyme baturini]|uniref:Factor VIII intron 22 protein-like n=1 Tax=Soboliphyme baturini TaxID=241478 RepID=A0A183J4F2_9BILA|nr:unnamed protein product [Soboliphyme baturini]
MEENPSYVDPWQEYKAINMKLKKRLLRKPNLLEAVKEFSALSLRLQDEECPQYAALCHMTMARCEQQIGNPAGENQNYRKAADLFVKAEKEYAFDLKLPTMELNLSSALHCYSCAIRSHIEQNQPTLAAALCMEVGCRLMDLDKDYESIEFFRQAANYFSDANPCGYYQSLQRKCMCEVNLGFYSDALQTLDNARTSIESWADTSGASLWQSRLQDIEAATVILLLTHDLASHKLNDYQSSLLKNYTTLSFQEPDFPSHVKRDCRLHLQSFVQSMKEEYCKGAELALTELQPYLKPYLMDLALKMLDLIRS